MQKERIVGKPVFRKEGIAKVCGAARYIDDFSLPGMIFGATVRSAIPRGRVLNIEFGPGIPWDEFDARHYQDSLAQARAHMGNEQLERAYAQGMALSLEKALDLALSSEAGPRSSEAGPRDSRTVPLSARERQIMALLAGGASNAKIAQTLFVTPNTVRTHLDRIRDKTGARNRAELTRYALQAGIEPVLPSP